MKSYSEYLIKKKWLFCHDTEEFVLVKSDCDLFLRIVRQLIMNSREENANIVDIYKRIDNRNHKEVESLLKHISELHQVIIEQKQMFGNEQSKLGSELLTKIDNLISDSSHLLEINCPLESHGKNVLIKKLNLPHTLQDARKISDSFITSLLCPFVNKNTEDGYAYILPSDILPISIASGLNFEHIRDDYKTEELHRRSIFCSPDIKNSILRMIQTEFGNECIHDNNDQYDTLNVAIGLWSDGCDAGGASKANRSLVKLTTIHVTHPVFDESHVFPIAFGNNKGDHELIRKKIMCDLTSLWKEKKLCYVPSLKKLVYIRFFLAYVIQDRVEHCDWTGFSGHGGVFSTVPCVSAPITIMGTNRSEHQHSIVCEKDLASCQECVNHRLNSYLNKDFVQSSKSNIHCANCNDWDLLSIKFKPHKDYPVELADLDENGYMSSKEITFCSMKSACEKCYSNIYLYKWTQSKMYQYARVECIKESVYKSIWKHANTNRPSKNEALLIQDPVPMPQSILPAGMNQEILRLDQCIVGVMHTLVLNLGKHLLLTVVNLLDGNEWTAFYDQCNESLKEVKSLSLSWCKAYHLGSSEKPGSVWVSENYLAFSMICKFMFSKMKNDGGEYTNILRTIWCYNSMLSYIMQPCIPSEDVCNIVQSLSKLFLTYFNSIDNQLTKKNMIRKRNSKRKVKEKKDVSKIESASCIINVLKVGEEMLKKGMQRNYWEGGLNGEGFFRLLKPLIKRGISQIGIFYSTTKKLYRIHEINSLIKHDDMLEEDEYTVGKNTTEEEGVFDTARYRRFHCYRTEEEIRNDIQVGKTIGAFFLKTTSSFYCCFQKKKEKMLMEINLLNAGIHMNMHTFSIIMVDAEIDSYKKIKDVSSNSLDYISVLLLPIQKLEGDIVVTKYYAHSEEHLEWKDGSWEHPSLYDYHYEHIETNDYIDENDADDIDFWQSKDKCNDLIGEEVIPLHDKHPGEIISFRHVDGKIARHTAKWKVRYFKETINEGRTYMTVEYGYEEIVDLIKL